MSYTLLSETFPVARKQHRCIWCGESIPPGEKYRSERSVFDGNMQNHKWHLECNDAAQVGWQEGDDAEFSPHENERPAKAPAGPTFDPWYNQEDLGKRLQDAQQSELIAAAARLAAARAGM